VDVFTALADPVRRDLLRRVSTEPVRAGDLAAEHQVSRPAISRHLKVLIQNGLVDVDTRGRERRYRIRLAGLTPVQQMIDALTEPGTTRHTPIVAPEHLLALETEVRRTTRDRQPTTTANTKEESA